jgi:hypothetical protein
LSDVRIIESNPAVADHSCVSDLNIAQGCSMDAGDDLPPIQIDHRNNCVGWTLDVTSGRVKEKI